MLRSYATLETEGDNLLPSNSPFELDSDYHLSPVDFMELGFFLVPSVFIVY